ncbi:MAG: serine/threonine-protein kinase [Acidobacteriota bacterium]
MLRPIASGAMGEVWEAYDLELQEIVALKTILPGIAHHSDILARFRREIKLARRVTHRNVCRIYDVFRHEGAGRAPVTFLTMELLRGETLAARLRRVGRLATSDALPIVRQLADGLDAAHRSGVIHRDFKTSNVILVDEKEGLRAVITDFGVARQLTGDDTMTSPQGGDSSARPPTWPRSRSRSRRSRRSPTSTRSAW